MASGFPDEGERFRVSEGADSWGEWRRHVLIQMEEHSKSLKEVTGNLQTAKGETSNAINTLRLDINRDMAALKEVFNDDIAGLKTEIAMLKVKAGFFGAFAGVVISLGIELMRRLLAR